jgi:hypothetical protein
MTRDERIAKIRGGRWIRYARAEEITARLDLPREFLAKAL